MEQKVLENQKLKKQVDNEKELWKNKANNLKRNSATKKPENLHNYRNCPSPQRKINKIDNNANDNNNNNNKDRETKNSSVKKFEFIYNNNNEIQASPIVSNKKEPLDYPIIKSVDKETSLNKNNYNENKKSPSSYDVSKSPMKKSVSSDDNNNEEDGNIRLNAKKVNNKKIIVNDINSDVDCFSQR